MAQILVNGAYPAERHNAWYSLVER